METTPKPFFHKFIDNIWTLCVAGLLIFFISYIAWGWFQIEQVPDFPEFIRQEILNP